MMEERIANWKYQWKEEGLAEGREEGREKGLQEGREEGREEGRQQGRRLGEAEVLKRLLKLKFGELPGAILARIERTENDADLLRWADRVLTAERLDQVFAD